MSRIGIVTVHYYPAYVEPSLATLGDLMRRVPVEAVIAVANREAVLEPLGQRLAQLPPARTELIRHDNSGLEFGAWQAGLARLRELELDWVVFANDTFPVHACFSRIYRRRLVNALQRPAVRGVPEVAGQVETLGKSYTIEGMRTHRWLTTSIFALNATVLRMLRYRLHYPTVDALIRPSGDRAQFFSPYLDPTVVDHLAAWLFGEGGSGAWYGATALDAASAPRLAAKARSILHEKYLSAVLDEAGAWFFDLKPYGGRERVTRRWDELVFRLSRGDRLRRREKAAAGGPGAST
jgi:hypothetical protein